MPLLERKLNHSDKLIMENESQLHLSVVQQFIGDLVPGGLVQTEVGSHGMHSLSPHSNLRKSPIASGRGLCVDVQFVLSLVTLHPFELNGHDE